MNAKTGAVRALLRAVCDEDRGVRVSSLEALARLGQNQSVLVVKEIAMLLNDKWASDPQRRVFLYVAAADVIQELSREDTNSQTLVPVVQACLADVVKGNQRKEPSTLEKVVIKTLVAAASVSFTSVSTPLLLHSKTATQAHRGAVTATGAIASVGHKHFSAFVSKVCGFLLVFYCVELCILQV